MTLFLVMVNLGMENNIRFLLPSTFDFCSSEQSDIGVILYRLHLPPPNRGQYV